MGRISIQHVRKQFGARIVLTDVSVELVTGRIVGLVGANGAGKTTLLKLIAGALEPDAGTITRTRGTDVGYLAQEPDVDPSRTLHDEVGSVFAKLLDIERRMHAVSEQMARTPGGPELARVMERYDRLNHAFTSGGGYTFEARLGEILGGLGFSEEDRALPVSALSGGQKCRAALAKLLLRDTRYLLLDEPTNHLDIDAVRWLEKFLAGHHGGAVIISHDRTLLDRVVDGIIEIADGRATEYRGTYTRYVEARRRRRLTLERQYEKDRETIQKERAFIARHLAGQRTKEAQGRRTRLARRIAAGEFVLERPVDARPVKIEFRGAPVRGVTHVRVDDLSKAYSDHVLFADLRLQVEAGQRLGITGPNGTGKSTLLKILLGEVAADGGTAWIDPKFSIGYYAQEPGRLDPDATVVEEVRSVRRDWSEERARSFLGAFNFRGDEALKPIGRLSGGEQSRVRLIRLILEEPDLLVLDEPTNHLDIASREALEQALAAFPGTIIVVSHDRYFLDRIADHLLVLRAGRAERYAGNYSDMLDHVERSAAGSSATPDRAAGAPGTASRPPARPRGRAAGAASPPPAPRVPDARLAEKARYDRHSVEELEVMLMEREQRLSKLTERFARPDVYRDRDALGRLEDEVDAMKHEMGIIEEAWTDRLEAQ